MALDKKNCKNLWYDAVAKDMCSVLIYFYIRGKGDTPPPGHQFIKCHMIFISKMEDLRRKVRMVAGGYMTDMPPSIT